MSPRRSSIALPLSLACVLGVAGLALLGAPHNSARAAEGEWLPRQIEKIHDRASRAGLELTAEQLWKGEGDETSGGLLRASVNYGGCSAAFVSPAGLIATNHHCAYGALQANSSVEHDYLKDGFLAKERGEELPAPGRSVRVLRKISDVSDKVDGALEGIEDDAARAAAYDKIKNQLVDECEQQAHSHCRVAGLFMGSDFELHEYLELKDVRLVYAPPSAIGEYGGETDNWMWPRHTGDFSLLRAYVGKDGEPAEQADDNVPYQPAQHLEPATDGVDAGDFAAVLGYPGNTDRYMWGAEITRHFEQWLPMRVEIYGEWIELLEAAGARDEAVGIKVAALKKSLANRHKNARGKLAGLERMNLAATRSAEDKRLAAQDAETIAGLEAVSAARRAREPWEFLLDNLRYAPRKLAVARDLVTWAQERKKPDLERKAGYRDRDRDRVWSRLEQMAKDHDREVDVELLSSFLVHADQLEDRRIPGFDKVMGAAKGAGPEDRAAYREAAAAALEGSELADPDQLEALFEDPKQLAKSKDPMVELARALVDEIAELDEIKQADRGRMLILGPAYFELVAKMRGGTLYPDANRTLRMSYGNIKGYKKWDGAEQAPQTGLTGAVAKHTGEGEFDLPDPVLAAAETAKDSRWLDREINDVPVCFLMDGDTTGGNSGSPVIDGQGRLIGFNFDRVWENVAGDYAWRPEHSRNIVSDVRYLYWMLEEVAGAEALLTELGVADYTPPPPPKQEAAEAKAGEAKPKPKPGCGCVSAGGDAGGLLGLLGLGLLGLGWRRRRPAQVRPSQ